MTIPPEFEAKARALVADAIRGGADLWETISPATFDLLVQATAADLYEAADIRAALARRGHATVHALRVVGSKTWQHHSH